eukprot:5301427-Prymnesium_polylepis.1
MGVIWRDHVEGHMRGHVGVTRLQGRADGEARVAQVEAARGLEDRSLHGVPSGAAPQRGEVGASAVRALARAEEDEARRRSGGDGGGLGGGGLGGGGLGGGGDGGGGEGGGDGGGGDGGGGDG